MSFKQLLFGSEVIYYFSPFHLMCFLFVSCSRFRIRNKYRTLTITVFVFDSFLTDFIIDVLGFGIGKSWYDNLLASAMAGVFEAGDIVKYGEMMIKRPPTHAKVRIKVIDF